MPEKHLRHPDLVTVLVDHLLKTKKECKNSKKQKFIIYSSKRTR